MKQKTLFLNCDLIDASENSSQGMIEILQKVHNIAVPHLRNEKQKDILEKVVFGGDGLTIEREHSLRKKQCRTRQINLMDLVALFIDLRGCID